MAALRAAHEATEAARQDALDDFAKRELIGDLREQARRWNGNYGAQR